jgi:hypothetical protein
MYSRAGNKRRFWESVSDAVNMLPSNDYPHSLPGNYRTLERAYIKYKASGYESLIHGGQDNANRTLIKDAIADYLLATYSLPVKYKLPDLMDHYNVERNKQGWPELTEQAVRNFLDKPENKRVWTLGRHGSETYKNNFAHRITRDRSVLFPNALWAIDGTKFDAIHFMDNDRKMAATAKINPDIDVYSEKIIGWDISTTENWLSHFKAIKSAVQNTMRKPFKFIYDNQGGHKRERMQELYDNVVAKDGVHHPTRPREKSNPAEQIFNRLQQQEINKFWFSDKQGVRVKKIDNVANFEFIEANKAHLPTLEGLLKVWELIVKRWNEGAHPSIPGKTRNEVYKSQAPHKEEVDILSMIDLFWLNTTEKPITYKRDGLLLRYEGEEYLYEVYDENDDIDIDFRRKYVGAKFVVRFDPEDMNGYVKLFEQQADGQLVFINYAQKKRAHKEVPITMQEGDKALWFKDFKVRDAEMERDLAELEALRVRTGITPEQLIEDQELDVKMQHILPKTHRNTIDEMSALDYL